MDKSFLDFFEDKEELKELISAMLYAWDGSFDFLSPNGDYVYYKNIGDLDADGFNKYCKFIRDNLGEEICKQCDIKYSKKAKNKNKPLYYICHAGLLDVTIPIIKDDIYYGSILFGQCLPDNDFEFDENEKVINNALNENLEDTANNIKITQKELKNMQKTVPKISKEKLEGAIDIIYRGTNMLVKLAQEKEEIVIEKTSYEHETKMLAEEISKLSIKDFWVSFESFLDNINDVIGANVSGILKFENNKWKLKTITNISEDNINISNSDPFFSYLNYKEKTNIINVNHEIINNSNIIKEIKEKSNTKLEKILLINFNLSDNVEGLLFFFLDNEKDEKIFLPIEIEKKILFNMTPQISTAYQNYQLFKAKKILTQDMIHQITAPIANIYSNAEYLNKGIKYYNFISIPSFINKSNNIENITNKIRTSAAMAVNLVRNFSWDVIPGKNIMKKDEIDDLLSLLIGCAIDYQALADLEDKKIKVLPINNENHPKFYTDSELFKQVIKNILENAVKYADNETIIFIKPIIRYNYIDISIINWGIPIKDEDLKNIFIRGERAIEAKKKTKGHGIGLSVSKEIIEKLNGKILVEPSEFNLKNNNYKTTFVIRIYL